MSSPKDNQYLQKSPKENVSSSSQAARYDDDQIEQEQITSGHETISNPRPPEFASSIQYDESELERLNRPSQELPKLPEPMERSYSEIEPESLSHNVPAPAQTLPPARYAREDRFHPPSTTSQMTQEPYSAIMRGEHESRRHHATAYEHWQQPTNPQPESIVPFETTSKHTSDRPYYSNPPPRHYGDPFYNSPQPPPHESYRGSYYRPSPTDQSHHHPHYQNPMNPSPMPPFHPQDYYQSNLVPHQSPGQYQYQYRGYDATHGPTQYHPSAERIQSIPPHPFARGEIYIEHLNKNDVLCGRGGATNSHVGNRNFRALVKEYQDKYLSAKKKDKPTVASEVVSEIRKRGGRFLEKVKDVGLWRDIGDKKAMEKTSQALREGAPKIRRQMLKDKDETTHSDGASPEKSIGTEEESSLRDSSIQKGESDSTSRKKRKLSDAVEKGIETDSTKLKTLGESKTPSLQYNLKDDSTGSIIDKQEQGISNEPQQAKARTDLQPYTMPLTRIELPKVDEKDLTQDEKSVYASFEPPKNNPRKQETETQVLPSTDTGGKTASEMTSDVKSEESV